MFVIGLFGTIAFGVLAAAVPSATVLVVARAGVEFREPQGIYAISMPVLLSVFDLLSTGLIPLCCLFFGLYRVDLLQSFPKDPSGRFEVWVSAQHHALHERQLVAVPARHYVQVDVHHRLEGGAAIADDDVVAVRVQGVPLGERADAWIARYASQPNG